MLICSSPTIHSLSHPRRGVFCSSSLASLNHSACFVLLAIVKRRISGTSISFASYIFRIAGFRLARARMRFTLSSVTPKWFAISATPRPVIFSFLNAANCSNSVAGSLARFSINEASIAIASSSLSKIPQGAFSFLPVSSATFKSA